MNDTSSRRILLLLHAGFVLAGMATTLLGPMMPLLMTRWSLSDAAAGTLFTAQFTGQTLATIASTVLTARLGDRWTLALGMLVTAAGVAAMTVAPWPWGVATTFLYGLGLGLVLPLTNFVVAAVRPAAAASALSLLNVSWGVGAVIWPLVVRVSVAATGAAIAPLVGLSLAVVVVALRLMASAADWPAARRAAASPAAGTSGAATRAIAGLVAVFAALSYLYVGTETSIGGWIAEFTRRASTGPGLMWAMAPTVFWGAETLGRLVCPLILRRRSEGEVLVVGLLLAMSAVLLLVVGSGSARVALVGAALAGVGLAPVFPLLIAAMTRTVQPVAPGLMGPLFAMGGVGGASLPWVVGLASTWAGNLQVGLAVPLAALVVMLLLQVEATRRARAVPTGR